MSDSEKIQRLIYEAERLAKTCGDGLSDCYEEIEAAAGSLGLVLSQKEDEEALQALQDRVAEIESDGPSDPVDVRDEVEQIICNGSWRWPKENYE